MANFSFTITAQDKNSHARAGVIQTRNGSLETPHFITVATGAAVRGLTSNDLRTIHMKGAIINTYHLHFQPGDNNIKKQGGAHKVMDFDGVLFSDSGGFQIFSLSHDMHSGINKLGSGNVNSERHERLVKITDEGISFKSVYDGKESFFNPEISMNIQSNLGSDIIMAFDECPSPLDDYEYNQNSLKRTHAWALESLKHHDPSQALYGIVQGGPYKDLRQTSADFITNHEFDGVAIGGVFGEGPSAMHQVLEWVIPHLDDRPRHLLGIGEVVDIFECVERGIDTFDCVMPTRVARHGMLLVSPNAGGTPQNKFRKKIGNAQYATDETVIEKNCTCHTCTAGITCKELRALFKKKDPDYVRYATMHNLHFMYDLMKQIRASIREGTFHELKTEWLGKKSSAE